MPYYDFFLCAVPTTNRDRYTSHAEQAWEIFRRHGALALHEAWGDDVPDGEVTSFPMAVHKQDDETVVASWTIWPDKATRDAGWQAIMQDPATDALGELPFDGKRMMWGGFAPILSVTSEAAPAA